MDQERTNEKAQLLTAPGPWHIITCLDRNGAPVWYVGHQGEPRFTAFLAVDAVENSPMHDDFFVLWVDGGPRPGQAAALRKQAIGAIRRSRGMTPLERAKVRRNEGRTCFDLLGVSLDASPEEIKAVYRALVRHRHPDLKLTGEVCGRQAPPAADGKSFEQPTAAYPTLRVLNRTCAYKARLPGGVGAVADHSPRGPLRFWKVRRRAGIAGVLLGLFSRPCGGEGL